MVHGALVGFINEYRYCMGLDLGLGWDSVAMDLINSC